MAAFAPSGFWSKPILLLLRRFSSFPQPPSASTSFSILLLPGSKKRVVLILRLLPHRPPLPLSPCLLRGATWWQRRHQPSPSSPSRRGVRVGSSSRCGRGTTAPQAAAAPAPATAVTGVGAARTGTAVGHRRGCTPWRCFFPPARICYCAPRNPSIARQGSVAAPTDPRRPAPSDAGHSRSAPPPAPGRVGCGVRGSRGQPCRAVFLDAFLILHLLRSKHNIKPTRARTNHQQRSLQRVAGAIDRQQGQQGRKGELEMAS
ncbi:uncharacterized protein [Miscanthus floridulus]|uniref:uncharacterized protein n=1 Tax=Miscanthus floridulus TaxID=154761 RepID=UPI00345A9B61